MRLCYLILALLLLTAPAVAADPLVFLDQVNIDYGQFKAGTRDPILYPDQPKAKLDVNIDIGFLKYGYMHNTVHSLTDDSQYRLIGWRYEVGAHIGPWADVYMEHFSQHVLDSQEPRGFFPLENVVGIRVYLYRR